MSKWLDELDYKASIADDKVEVDAYELKRLLRIARAAETYVKASRRLEENPYGDGVYGDYFHADRNLEEAVRDE